jgi:hypothetical protein
MSVKKQIASLAALAFLATATFAAVADDHPYKEGPVVNIARIRTVDGKFDEYMAWLSTTWKKQQEAAKKKGYIVSYQILSVEPRSPEDADLLLVTTYKNWAALDDSLAKGDEVTKLVEGSLTAASASQSARGKIRTVLGSSTMQELLLK